MKIFYKPEDNSVTVLPYCDRKNSKWQKQHGRTVESERTVETVEEILSNQELEVNRVT